MPRIRSASTCSGSRSRSPIGASASSRPCRYATSARYSSGGRSGQRSKCGRRRRPRTRVGQQGRQQVGPVERGDVEPTADVDQRRLRAERRREGRPGQLPPGPPGMSRPDSPGASPPRLTRRFPTLLAGCFPAQLTQHSPPSSSGASPPSSSGASAPSSPGASRRGCRRTLPHSAGRPRRSRPPACGRVRGAGARRTRQGPAHASAPRLGSTSSSMVALSVFPRCGRSVEPAGGHAVELRHRPEDSVPGIGCATARRSGADSRAASRAHPSRRPSTRSGRPVDAAGRCRRMPRCQAHAGTCTRQKRRASELSLARLSVVGRDTRTTPPAFGRKNLKSLRRKPSRTEHLARSGSCRQVLTCGFSPLTAKIQSPRSTPSGRSAPAAMINTTGPKRRCPGRLTPHFAPKRVDHTPATRSAEPHPDARTADGHRGRARQTGIADGHGRRRWRTRTAGHTSRTARRRHASRTAPPRTRSRTAHPADTHRGQPAAGAHCGRQHPQMHGRVGVTSWT